MNRREHSNFLTYNTVFVCLVHFFLLFVLDEFRAEVSSSLFGFCMVLTISSESLKAKQLSKKYRLSLLWFIFRSHDLVQRCLTLDGAISWSKSWAVGVTSLIMYSILQISLASQKYFYPEIIIGVLIGSIMNKGRVTGHPATLP